MKKNLHTHIDETMKEIRVNDSMKKTIRQNLQKETQNKPKITIRTKKIAAIAAAAAIIAAYPLTVAARHLPLIADWVTASVSEKYRDYLYPVGKSCTDNGIRVTVESAVNDGHQAEIYFTVQDIEGKGRIGKDLDLCDSYRINIGGDSTASACVEYYDSETQTAMCYTYMMVENDVTNHPVTISMDMLMSNATETGLFDTGLTLADLLPETVQVSREGKLITGYTGENGPDKNLKLLEPDVMRIPLREDIGSVYISNIGFIDGRLHIQTKWEKSFDNHGWTYLYKGETADVSNDDFALLPGKVDITDSVSFRTDEDQAQCGYNSFVKHQEDIFDIRPEDIDQYKLLAELYLDGDIIRGDWRVSYQMQGADKISYSAPNADAIEITPLGVYVLGYSGNGTPDVTVSYRNGSRSENDDFMLESVTGWFSKKRNFYVPNEYAELFDSIESVTLDGEEAVRQ